MGYILKLSLIRSEKTILRSSSLVKFSWEYLWRSVSRIPVSSWKSNRCSKFTSWLEWSSIIHRMKSMLVTCVDVNSSRHASIVTPPLYWANLYDNKFLSATVAVKWDCQHCKLYSLYTYKLTQCLPILKHLSLSVNFLSISCSGWTDWTLRLPCHVYTTSLQTSSRSSEKTSYNSVSISWSR